MRNCKVLSPCPRSVRHIKDNILVCVSGLLCVLCPGQDCCMQTSDLLQLSQTLQHFSLHNTVLCSSLKGPVWGLIVNMLSCVWENEFCFQTLVVTRSCPQQAQWQPGPTHGPGLWLVSSASPGPWLADRPPSPCDSWPLGPSHSVLLANISGREYIVQT